MFCFDVRPIDFVHNNKRTIRLMVSLRVINPCHNASSYDEMFTNGQTC